MRQYQKNPKISGQYEGLTYLRDGVPTFNGTVRIHPERLALPNRTKKPTVWAVWDDLFHESITDFSSAEVLDRVCREDRHTFLILTKRVERMCNSVRGYWGEVSPVRMKFPSHVWFGVTICTQAEADEKLPIFLQVPGKKFLSVEPLLEYIDLQMAVEHFQPLNPDFSRKPHLVSLVVVGPETGPHRRPCDINLIRDIKDQCQSAGVPLFIKALNLNGKISTDMTEWPKDLRIRQLPWLSNLKS
jgi:protein gp37